jgi:UDP-N-acetylglucosamine 2-epimerase
VDEGLDFVATREFFPKTLAASIKQKTRWVFGRHILITRESTERPEVVTAGFGILVGSDYGAIVGNARCLTSGDRSQILAADNPFGRGNASEKIAARLVNVDQLPAAATQ